MEMLMPSFAEVKFQTVGERSGDIFVEGPRGRHNGGSSGGSVTWFDPAKGLGLPRAYPMAAFVDECENASVARDYGKTDPIVPKTAISMRRLRRGSLLSRIWRGFSPSAAGECGQHGTGPGVLLSMGDQPIRADLLGGDGGGCRG